MGLTSVSWLLGGERPEVESLTGGDGGSLCGDLQPPPLPSPLFAPAAAILGGRVFVCGGSSGGLSLSDCYTIRGRRLSQGWQRTSPLPLNTSHAATAVRGENFFVLGGEREPRCEPRPQVQILNSRRRSWSLSPNTDPPSSLGSLPSHSCAVTAGHLIFLTGGWELQGCQAKREDRQELDQVLVLNTLTGGWEKGPSLNTRRRSHGCTLVEVAGRIVSIKGEK